MKEQNYIPTFTALKKGPYTEPEEIQLFLCLGCSSVIRFKSQHDRFHRRIKKGKS